MSPEGSSGSPLVNAINGKLIGVISKRIYQFAKTDEQEDKYKISTNFSYAVPTYFLQSMIDVIKNDTSFKVPKKVFNIENQKKIAKKIC